jgi:hypothetical protein
VANTKRPRTGERRQVNQPLKIDKLPPKVHEAILMFRNKLGRTWEEIEALSALPAKAESKADRGFVDWDSLETEVLGLFPERRLPHTSLHRWYDLRVSQVRRDVEQRSVVARQLAESFAKSAVDGSDEAVINAARDQLMSLLAEDLTPGGRAKAAAGLIALAEILQAARANDIKERKVGVDERRISVVEAREQAARERVDQATQQAVKKGTGQFSIDDINLLRERTFGLPPLVISHD